MNELQLPAAIDGIIPLAEQRGREHENEQDKGNTDAIGAIDEIPPVERRGREHENE